MRVIFQPAALKFLAGMARKDREALLKKLSQFAVDPFAPFAAAKPLAGSPHAVRLRHRHWRAVCRIDREGGTVIVESLGDRREIYR